MSRAHGRRLKNFKVSLYIFNATVTYITHVTELDRFIKTTLFWYGLDLVPFQPMRIILNSKPSASLEAEGLEFIMIRID